MTLSEKQNVMIAEINRWGDCFEQYSYLLVKSQELPSMPENLHIGETLVPGCQSKVWLSVRTVHGRVYFDADSDTLILKGVLQLLRELLWGEEISEVSALHITLFTETELAATFTSDRNTGVREIIRRIASCKD